VLLPSPRPHAVLPPASLRAALPSALRAALPAALPAALLHAAFPSPAFAERASVGLGGDGLDDPQHLSAQTAI
jgi:hypothetical protein